MSKPRPPRPTASAGLDEVERALSTLGGRHPEHERTRRETAIAAERRRTEIAAELEQKSRAKIRRAVLLVGGVGVAGAAAYGVARFAARASGVREALAKAEAPFVARGLAEVTSNALRSGPALDGTTPGPGCYVALTSTGSVQARVGAAELAGHASVGWCSCGPAPVHVAAAGAAEGTPALALLRIDGEAVGGPLGGAKAALGADDWSDPGLARDCQDAMLDGWIAQHSGPPRSVPSLDDLATVTGSSELVRAGLHPVATVAPGESFAVVSQGEDECLVALDDSARLSLRTTGGARPVDGAAGALAWCGHAKAVVSVWRSSAGDGVKGAQGTTMVASVGRDRIGGLFGLGEALRDAGFTLAPRATWLAPGALEREAVAMLKASTLLDAAGGALPAEPVAPDKGAPVVALVTGNVGAAPEGALLGCDPPIAKGAALVESVCATATATGLWHEGTEPGFYARAEYPIFLSSLTAQRAPAALAKVPALLALARRLARSGFEPTILEGVKELDGGVRIAGRAAEDAVVAIGVGPTAPWVFPYSDGPRWSLGGAPRVVPLAPGATVTLTAIPGPTAPLDKRRTVVFRRTSRPAL